MNQQANDFLKTDINNETIKKNITNEQPQNIPNQQPQENSQQTNQFIPPQKEQTTISQQNIKDTKRTNNLQKKEFITQPKQKRKKQQNQQNKKRSPPKVSIIPLQQIKEQQQIHQRQFIINDNNPLANSGILDAYEHFLKLLCKHGLPTGRVFHYAAQQIEKYQKRKRNKELKMRAELDIQKIVKKSTPVELTPQKDKSLSGSRKQ